jgi:hypothetical protein
MLFNTRLLSAVLLGIGIGVATTTQAGVQLFDGSWTIKAFGNECSKADKSPGPHCPSNPGGATGPSEFYEAYGMPQGLLCNPYQPRCHFDSTPTNGLGQFNVLGGSRDQALFCAPWANWSGGGATMRPAKGSTPVGTDGRPIPPLYRNPAFFTMGGQPNTYSCLGQSTDGYGGPGLVMLGNPVTGRWEANTTGTQRGGFTFAAAPANGKSGIRVGQGSRSTYGGPGSARSGAIGEFGAVYPYVYSYTYATLHNDAGLFGPNLGPGDFDFQFPEGASINVKQGAAKFGGTMRMLGALTSKVCYYWRGGCSLGGANWRYEQVGASAQTAGGVVTDGYHATYKAYYYHTELMQKSTVQIDGSRFPWTTGSVTVTAVGNGPHKTVHYAKGFDNRNTATPDGMGTIQLVTPVLTRWTQPALNITTGGVGILRIKFLPEPQAWVMLVAGFSFLGVVKRMRGR